MPVSLTSFALWAVQTYRQDCKKSNSSLRKGNIDLTQVKSGCDKCNKETGSWFGKCF